MNTTTNINTASAGPAPAVNQAASNSNINDDDDVLDFSNQNLDHRDLKRILTKLGSSGREYRPRKCRRVDVKRDEIDSRIHAISCSKKPVYKLRFAGNPAIGDLGMKQLSLIPDSFRHLDFGDCNLSCEGIKTVCEFIARNTTITRLFLGGNGMNDEAAEAVGQMLEENDTLYELCINATRSNDYNKPSNRAVFEVCYGLRSNQALRHLHFTSPNFTPLGEVVWYLHFCWWLPDDSPLETLECGHFPSHFDTILERVYQEWGAKLEKNQHLRSITGSSFLKTPKANEIRYYLNLNRCNARRVVSDPNSCRDEWLDSVTWATRKHKRDVLYYLIRNKPEVCKLVVD